MLLLLAACNADYKGPVSADGLYIGSSPPTRADVVVELVDANGRGVSDWTGGEVSISIDDDELAHTKRTWDQVAAEQPVVVLVDIAVDDSSVLTSYRSFLTRLVDGLDDDQPLTILTFGETVDVHRASTRNADLIATAIDELNDSADGPTNLHDGVIDGLATWDDQLEPDGAIRRGVLVVLTDGGTSPSDSTLEQVRTAAEGRAVMGVALGRPGGLDDVATHGLFEAKEAADLPPLADDVATALQELQDAIVFASWCNTDGDKTGALAVDFARGTLKGSLEENMELIDVPAVWGASGVIPEEVQTHSARISDGYMYVGGGDEDGSTWYAPLRDDGRVGSWRPGQAIDSGEETRFHVADGWAYAVNGGDAYRGEIVDGAPQGWTIMLAPGATNALRSHGGRLYSITRDDIWVTELDNGDPTGWTLAGEYPEELAGGYVGGAFVGDRVVAVGSWRSGADSDWTTRAYAADVNADGSLGDFDTYALPAFMGLWLNVDAVGDELVVLPGDDADSSDILVGDGVGGWSVAGSFSAARTYYATAVEGDRLFILGGRAADEPTDELLYSELVDGTLSLSCTP
ncbi:MAG: VWA domain-containing protein [Proteobacteria bacterium]|nr:VWA domain-containing protein [Pseudomonadota bacterium]MCP4919704.1 VWA domain-containing protein [Pseudomonadota bacterium]